MSKLYSISFSSFSIVALLLICSCSPTRRVPKGEYLLVRNKIIDKSTTIPNSEFESYIKQKTNRKIFLVLRFHLWLHNLVNEERVKRRRVNYEAKLERKNAKRIAKGKEIKTSDKQLLGERILSISEPPVIYDSLLTKKTSLQLKSLLHYKGYFISSVKDSAYFKSRKKVVQYYIIKAQPAYTVNSIYYQIADKRINNLVLNNNAKSILKGGQNYDEDVLQKERDRITTLLNNDGYYFFTKDYIYFKIDTNKVQKKVDVYIGIKNLTDTKIVNNDTVLGALHQQYYINNIFIQTSNTANNQNIDTLRVDDYYFLDRSNINLKTRIILNAIFFKKGDLYQLKDFEDTYKRLSELRSFRTVNISYQEIAGNKLDCFITINPVIKQSYTIETQVKNTSGAPGIEGSFSYQNRNLIRGAELLDLRFKGGWEFQNVYNDETQQTNAGNLNNPIRQFNTLELGPELNLYIPRFVLPFSVSETKRTNAKTILTSSFTYQRRADYTRSITNLSLGYSWKETFQKKHTISPLVINFVRVQLSEQFSNYLSNQVQNLYILNSFINHLSTSTRYSFTYNEQEINKQKNFIFFRLNAESSGNILRGIYQGINSINQNTFVADDQGRYKLSGIVYSQYLRFESDLRYYYFANESNKVVWRFAAGVGKPLANLPSLPFERSFFSGGANGIRAWQNRTLGPGSYSNKGKFVFDQYGDGMLELNLEYRFKLIKQFSGALFVDAGNNWLRGKDTNRPGGDFQFNRFYKEIAIGSGVGIRADFNFFIIRLDMGVKIRDPQFEESKRWVISNFFNQSWKSNYQNDFGKKYNFLTFNIGIGYPF